MRYIKNTEVTFNCKCITKFGEKVGLVGNIPLLGHWDPNRSIVMMTDNDSFPNWTIKIDLPRDKIIEYKYLIITKEIIPQGRRTSLG